MSEPPLFPAVDARRAAVNLTDRAPASVPAIASLRTEALRRSVGAGPNRCADAVRWFLENRSDLGGSVHGDRPSAVKPPDS